MFTNIHKISTHLILVIASLCTISTATLAGPVTIPNNFSADTPAVAAEVNANFSVVKTAVDDNDSRIAALEASITSLQNSLAAIQNNSVLALDGKLVAITDNNGFDTAQFTGVNVQVINGVDQTTINGLGNLVIGYNNPRTAGALVCSNGQYADQPTCEGAGEIWAQNHKSGSHNLVAGDRNSYSQTSGVVFGAQNAVIRNYAGVSGGRANIAGGTYSSVSGGVFNEAIGDWSSVSGGQNNTASGSRSSVSGGRNNDANGDYSSTSGGNNRDVTGIDDWSAGSLFEDL